MVRRSRGKEKVDRPAVSLNDWMIEKYEEEEEEGESRRMGDGRWKRRRPLKTAKFESIIAGDGIENNRGVIMATKWRGWVVVGLHLLCGESERFPEVRLANMKTENCRYKKVAELTLSIRGASFPLISYVRSPRDRVVLSWPLRNILQRS